MRKRPIPSRPRLGPCGFPASVLLVGIGALALILATVVFMHAPWDTAGPADWPGFGYDAAASRANPAETRIDAATVGRLRRAWQATLPDVADSSPAYLRALAFPDGRTRDVLYLTTRSGSLVALDAVTGARLWVHRNPAAGPNMVTTSSPLAVPARGAVFSYGMDGKVHEYDAVSGAELFGDGWPATVTNMPSAEKESSALNAANGYLYVATASCCGDAGAYQGHVVAIDLATGAEHVFNALCSGRAHLLAPGECREVGAGVWARAGVVVDPVTGNLFFATGNGPYTADRGGHDWGESVLELTPNGARLVDSYTPAAPNALSPQDLDLGSAAPALLPAIPGARADLLAVQASKEGALRLLNRRDLSGRRGPGHTGGELQTIDAPDHCPVLTQPVVWRDPAGGGIWVFVADGCAIGGYRVVVSAAGDARLRPVWSVGTGATSPIMAGGLLFAAATVGKQVVALEPRTGRTLWSSAERSAGGSIGPVHWESLIVVGGRVFCADELGHVTAYALAPRIAGASGRDHGPLEIPVGARGRPAGARGGDGAHAG